MNNSHHIYHLQATVTDAKHEQRILEFHVAAPNIFGATGAIMKHTEDLEIINLVVLQAGVYAPDKPFNIINN